MYRRCLTLAIVGTLALARGAVALDQIKKIDGGTTSCRITEVSATKISYEQGALKKDMGVNEVAYVIFEGEPGPLKVARSHILAARYEEALNSLGKLEITDATRKEAVQDAQFYRAFATAKLALAGSGTIAEAGKLMMAFVKTQPTSYHYLEASEVLGDLLVANRNYELAAEYFSKLAETPWPDFKMRAGVALGRALLAQKKVAEAQKAFDGVLALQAKGPTAETQRAAARLGKIRCLSETGKQDEVIKLVEDFIDKTDPDKKEIMAQAYNVLGSAFRKANRPKDAVIAFLHVDQLYSSVADAHAEALANLAHLWQSLQQTERAVRAQRTLTERYGNSPWAKP